MRSFDCAPRKRPGRHLTTGRPGNGVSQFTNRQLLQPGRHRVTLAGMKRAALLALLGITAMAGTTGAASQDAASPIVGDERLAANQRFRAAFDQGRYGEALPEAMRVVEATRSRFGEEAPELVNPLTNLATTYYRLHRNEQALDTYQAALALMADEADSADLRLVAPLQGLGFALRRLERDDEAIVPLKRAVDILRNREGLFTPRQLPLLRALAAAYAAGQFSEEAGSTWQYALTVAENQWGRDDLQLLPLLDAYATWNEDTGRFSPARVLHSRAVQIAFARESVADQALAIPALRGIARTYRQAYLYGEPEDSVRFASNQSMADAQLTQMMSAPSGAGERALRQALELARARGDAGLGGEVLVDLGDWYLTAGSTQRAVACYQEAWTSLQAAGRAAQLATPVAVAYRPSSVSSGKRATDTDRYEARDIDFTLTVSANGEVKEARATQPQAGLESTERAVVSALRRARFRPAIVDGKAVDHPGLVLRERVYTRIQEPATPAS